MKKTISLSDFQDAFQAVRPNNFTRDGLEALFNYLEEVAPDYDLDVIALCCEFTEYASLEEFQEAYGTDYESIEGIERETTVITFGDSFIIQDF